MTSPISVTQPGRAWEILKPRGLRAQKLEARGGELGTADDRAVAPAKARETDGNDNTPDGAIAPAQKHISSSDSAASGSEKAAG